MTNLKDTIELIPATGGEDNSFVGLTIVDNRIQIHYPESYCFSEEDFLFRREVIDLLQSFSLLKHNDSSEVELYNTHGIDSDFALLSYLWLIQDYLVNGEFSVKEKTYARGNQGNINWKRTLQQKPCVSGHNTVYLNLITEKRRDADNILIEAYRFCLKKSIDYLGWLYKLDSSFLKPIPFNENRKKLYTYTIERELKLTFEDHCKQRLTHLLNILTGLNANCDSIDFKYGVSKYYTIFEKMIDGIYGNVADHLQYNPIAHWHISGKEYATSNLYPDTILERKNESEKTIFVIDSKYYRYGHTANPSHLPETSSIQKQITYGEHILNSAELGVSKVYNIFILPFDHNGQSFKTSETLRYVGYATATWKQHESPSNSFSYEHIHTYLIDLKTVIKKWKFGHNVADCEQLITDVERRELELAGQVNS